MEDGYIESLTGFFPVSKAKTDICLVDEPTKCGLNEVVWCTNFFIPSPDSLYNLVDHYIWMADTYLGEFFLNFHLTGEYALMQVWI